METSEERKERLRAMRAAALQTPVLNNAQMSATPGGLLNPLSEPSNLEGGSTETSRFGFYTDPMAAFSSTNKRNKTDTPIGQDHSLPRGDHSGPQFPQSSPHLPGPCSLEMTNSHMHQSQLDPRMHQPQNSFNNHMGKREWSPRGMVLPPANQAQPPGNYPSNGHGFGPPGIPQYNHGHQSHMHPRMHQTQDNYNNHMVTREWKPRGNIYLPTNQAPSGQYQPTQNNSNNHMVAREWRPRGNIYPPTNEAPPGQYPPANECGLRPPGSPGYNYGQGRAQSPSPWSGRGGGFRRGGGGRERNFRSQDFEAGRNSGGECYCDRSIKEDPWKDLKPVLWKGSGNGSSSSSFPSEPVSSKKSESSEAFSKPNPKQNLAEFLASSLSETINDTLT